MADLVTWRLPPETKEWVGPLTVTADGEAVTAFDVTVTAPGQRPADWAPPTALGGALGALVGAGSGFPLLPGRKYTLWIRFTDVPETPVLQAGLIRTF
jgi:hypothetical protein